MIRTPIQNEVVRNAVENAQVRLIEDYKIKLDNPEVTYTILETVLDEIFKSLKNSMISGENLNTKINLADLITIGIVNRESETGEKSGNITLLLEASPNAKLMFKNDAETEKDNL